MKHLALIKHKIVPLSYFNLNVSNMAAIKFYLMMALMTICVFFSHFVNAASEGQLKEGMINPGFYEKPTWFKQSFLDLRDDLEDANDNNKYIMLYFHQDGCPYCKKLLDDNFSQLEIVDKMKKNFDLLEINMWGDKTVTSLNGEEITEKEFARRSKVMFTPTLVILDKEGEVQFRMNGYYDPEKYTAVLDYVLMKGNSRTNSARGKLTFNEFYQQRLIASKHKPNRQPSNKLHTEAFIQTEKDFKKMITDSHQPVMILFEQKRCADCDELHGDIFRRLEVYKKLKQFTIAQVDINSDDSIVTPDGQNMSMKDYASAMNIHYTPSIVFYKAGQSEKPVFRSEGYLKSFHIKALFDYVNTGAYETESEFQRFVQRRADKMREQGIEVNLWD